MATNHSSTAAAINNRDAVLVSAVYQARWADVGMLLERGVSDTSHRWAVKLAGQRLEGSALANYILPHSRDDQLDVLLPEVVRRGQWWVVGQLLKRGVGDEAQRAWAVEEATKRASDAQLSVLIAPYCVSCQLDSVLTVAVRRELWESVCELLKHGVSDVKCRWAIEEVCTNGPDTVVVANILRHCSDDQLESVLKKVVRRHLWHSVCELLQHAVDDKLRRWAVDVTVQYAGSSQQSCILPYCADGQLDFTVRFSVQKGLWQCVGQLLQRGVQSSLHAFAVTECRKHGTEKDLVEYILPHCTDDQVISVLETAVKRDLWGVVASQLYHHCITEDRRQSLFIKASKRASEGCLVSQLLPVCRDETLSLMLPDILKRGLWRAVCMLLKRGLSNSQRKWIGTEAVSRPYSRHLSGILPMCCEGHFETLFVTAIRRRCWDGVLVLLTCELTDTQRGWAVEEVSKVAKEHFLITEVLGKCPDDNADAVVDILVQRRLWKAVACLFKSRNVSVSKIGMAFEEASKTAKEDLVRESLNVVQYCPDSYVHSVLTTVVKREFWETVAVLLHRSISNEDCEWALEEACRSAKESWVSVCLGRCPAVNVDSVLAILLKRGFWDALCLLVSRHCDETQRLLVVEAASKRAKEHHLVGPGCILSNCPETHVEPILERLVRRGLWRAVEYLLSEHNVSEHLRGRIVVKACGAVKTYRCLYLLGRIVSHCPDDKVESVITTAVKKGLWQVLPQLMERSISPTQHMDVAEAALKLLDRPRVSFKNEDMIRRLILMWGMDGNFVMSKFAKRNEHVDFVMSEFAKRHQWHRFCQIVQLAKFHELFEGGKDSDVFNSTLRDGTSLLDVLCASGLWKTLAVVAPRVADPLKVNLNGQSLLSHAAAHRLFPEKLVGECLKLGVSTHQPSLTQAAEGKCTVVVRQPTTSTIIDKRIHAGSPLECAVVKGSTVLIKALCESGACSYSELHKVHMQSVLENPNDDELSEAEREVKNFLETLATTPRTLMSLCRLVISHHIVVGKYREEKVRQLPLPDNLQHYLLFSDVVDQLCESDTCQLTFFEASYYAPRKIYPRF